MPGRVLIVDDNPLNLKVLEAKLSSEYYDVVTAIDGPSALEIAATVAPDIILLDVMMPGMNGFEVCVRLKADPRTSHIPVIIVTALNEVSDRVKGLEAGADDFLSKPVHDLSLFSRVRSLVRFKLLTDVWQARHAAASRLGMTAESPLLSVENESKGNILLLAEPGGESVIEQVLRADGHGVTCVPLTDAALDVIRVGNFDLAVAEMHPEQGDVVRFCSHMRSTPDDVLRSLPILLVALANTPRDVIAKALDIGVNDYIQRPIEPPELRARVRLQIRRRRYQDRLRLQFEQSVAMASTDPLTSAYNRRYLDIHLDHLFQQAKSLGKPLAVAFCDIDHFKTLNDTYGHAAGDAALVEFTQRLTRNLRNFDVIARIGGEEFLVVMPETTLARGLRIAERLRRRVSDKPFDLGGGQSAAVTVSIGLATLRPEDSQSGSLVRRADLAMFEAKKSGRNRVKVAADESP